MIKISAMPALKPIFRAETASCVARFTPTPDFAVEAACAGNLCASGIFKISRAALDSFGSGRLYFLHNA